MTQLIEAIEQPCRLISVDSIPAVVELPAELVVSLLFTERTNKIQLCFNLTVLKYTINQQEKFTHKGFIAFAICLQNGFFSSEQLVRFLDNCPNRTLTKVICFLIPRFEMFYSTN